MILVHKHCDNLSPVQFFIRVKFTYLVLNDNNK